MKSTILSLFLAGASAQRECQPLYNTFPQSIRQVKDRVVRGDKLPKVIFQLWGENYAAIEPETLNRYFKLQAFHTRLNSPTVYDWAADMSMTFYDMKPCVMDDFETDYERKVFQEMEDFVPRSAWCLPKDKLLNIDIEAHEELDTSFRSQMTWAVKACEYQPASPATPATPAMPAIQARPATPAMPAIAAIPARPAFPAIPASEGTPDSPPVMAMPATPAMPAVPAMPATEAMPEIPAIAARPAMPAQPAKEEILCASQYEMQQFGTSGKFVAKIIYEAIDFSEDLSRPQIVQRADWMPFSTYADFEMSYMHEFYVKTNIIKQKGEDERKFQDFIKIPVFHATKYYDNYSMPLYALTFQQPQEQILHHVSEVCSGGDSQSDNGWSSFENDGMTVKFFSAGVKVMASVASILSVAYTSY